MLSFQVCVCVCEGGWCHVIIITNYPSLLRRRHLSSRLLCGRSLSLPLERRLAHAFAHCFPNKYPLQMLQDFEESEDLMDRFCANDLLERLDQVMAQANMHTQVRQGVWLVGGVMDWTRS